MTTFLKLLAFALLGLVSGCSLLGKDLRAPSFAHDAVPPTATLVLIGGNAECTGDKGIWRLRDTIADDVAKGLGFTDRFAITLRYFGWTGDLPGTGGCLPEHWSYLDGEAVILAALRRDHLLDGSRPLVVVGWSNGGAAANQLAALISADSRLRPVDLLVTLDPVSFFTHRMDPGRTLIWQNVYIRSKSFWTKFRDPGDFIAGVGGAWNDFGPASLPCIQANHGDVWKMWNEVLRREKFAAWVNLNRLASPAATVSDPHPDPDDGTADDGPVPCRP